MHERQTNRSGEPLKPISLDIQILYDGLDAAAPTEESWKAGYNAYQLAIEGGLPLDEAYWSALDAAAPTKDLWKAGYLVRQKLIEAAEEVITTPYDQPAIEAIHSVEHEPSPLRTVSSSLEKKSTRRSVEQLSQDVIIVDDTRGLYGVYDGMGGGGGNPRAAAQAMSDSIRRTLGSVQPTSKSELMDQLKNAYYEADGDVRREGERGSTVATTVKVVNIEGRTYAGVAHAGDTRLFVYSKHTDTYTPITEDQSLGHRVFNGFPRSSAAERDDQYEIIELEEGDRLMLCSDGITGDWPPQFLSDADFLWAFRQPTTDECAASFLFASTKVDDKSIIVVDVISDQPDAHPVPGADR